MSSSFWMIFEELKSGLLSSWSNWLTLFTQEFPNSNVYDVTYFSVHPSHFNTVPTGVWRWPYLNHNFQLLKKQSGAIKKRLKLFL